MKTYSNNKIHKVSYFSPEVFWSLKGDSSNQNKLRIIYLFIYCLCFLVDCFILSKFFLFNFFLHVLAASWRRTGGRLRRLFIHFAQRNKQNKKKTKQIKPRLAITVCWYLLSEFLGNTWLRRSFFSLYESVEFRGILKIHFNTWAFGKIW